MDSPSLDSPQPTVLSHRELEAGDVLQTVQRTGRTTRADIVLIASFGNAVAADYAAFVSQQFREQTPSSLPMSKPSACGAARSSLSMDEFLRSTLRPSGASKAVSLALILFVDSRLTTRDRRELDDFLRIARRWQTKFVGIVSTLSVPSRRPRGHGRSRTMSSLERPTCRLASWSFGPVMCLAGTPTLGSVLSRFAPFYPLIPKRLSSCFIEGTEFFVAVETERLRGRRPAAPWTHGQSAEPDGDPEPGWSIRGSQESGLHIPGLESILARHALSSSSAGPTDSSWRQPSARFFPGSWSAR